MKQMICLNGKLVAAADARISPFDHGFLYGDGIYETMRTLGGTAVFDFDAHLARLRKSGLLLELPIPWSDVDVKTWTDAVIRANGFAETRIRISVTRGENGFRFLGASNPTLVIAASPLDEYGKYTAGVALVSLSLSRLLPEAKSMALLPMILGKQAAERVGAFDTLFTDADGFVTEGTVFNIVMRRGNELIGAKHGSVLAGTAQTLLMQLAETAGYAIREARFTQTDLAAADEVLITNSLFGCLPVKKIDAKSISSCPGELFEKCGHKFWEQAVSMHK